MMKTATLMLFMAAVSCSSCSAESYIDGSTQESFEQSIKDMAMDMSEEDKEAFAKGLINLVINRYPPAQGTSGMQFLSLIEPATKAASTTLNGVSKTEILETGRALITDTP